MMTVPTIELYRDSLLRDIDTYGGSTILDHASRTSEELDADTVALALDLGWTPVDALDLGDDVDGIIPANVDEDAWQDARAERMGWAAEDAISWLNDHAAPAGTYIAHDGEAGALVCAPIDEA